ncbi:3-ketoacyl-CoA synthase 13 [Acorus calamus]|uniref:3-ketoacyl-CoA synthase n=1 Tax=Acorus calamus TaxID=4465 RepID=A0AAV9C046_ACOCL|nr:3-ketoacyl-CoA synthase 13 [Acorus calamus]
MKLFHLSLVTLLTLTLILALLTTTPTTITTTTTNHPLLLASLTFSALALLLLYRRSRPHPVLLVDYACYKPDFDRKCSSEACKYFISASRRFSSESESFISDILAKSGIGDEVYAPPLVFQTDNTDAKLRSAFQEAEEGMFSAVDSLLDKTHIHPSMIDILIVACSVFAPSPSLSSLIVNKYKLNPDIKTYNLSGMGCSAATISIDLAAKILRSTWKPTHALIVATENISLNWYFGDNRPMLVGNCLFRVGAAAVLLSNDARRWRSKAKMELSLSLRTHRGADNAAHNSAMQMEDALGNIGVSLSKDLVRVAGEGLRVHMRALAPLVLPLSEILRYACARAMSALARGKGRARHVVPDFMAGFEHACVHTGGKVVIAAIGRTMGLDEYVTEPARMALHRFGNTSSSLVFYQLAYFEAKGRVKAGDRLWMVSFGTGFKACSLVWTALRDSASEADNPWNDCEHRYPVKGC